MRAFPAWSILALLPALAALWTACEPAGSSKAAPGDPDPTPGGISGLDFPSNEGIGAADLRFRFSGSALIPMYPATYIWRIRVRRQDGYYTTFFWGPEELRGTDYYGAHPYPDNGLPSGNTHKWEMSIAGKDVVDDANGHSTRVEYDAWKTQAFRAFDDGSEKVHEFFWDWPDTAKVIRVRLDRGYGSPQPGDGLLNFGDAPWSIARERLSGVLRGLQLYAARLSLSDIAGEIAEPMGTSAGAGAIWYLNVNPTPGDISDKSGQGHHPAWVASARPALWTGP